MDSLQIASCTVNAKLTRCFRVENLFYLLNISPLSKTNQTPGTLLYATFRDVVKGFPDKKVKSFANTMTLVFSTSQKTPSVRISMDTIQVMGAKSEEHFTEIYGYIVKFVESIFDNVNYIRNLNIDAIEREFLQVTTEYDIHPQTLDYEPICTNFTQESGRLAQLILPVLEDSRPFVRNVIDCLRSLKTISEIRDPVIIEDNIGKPMEIQYVVYDNINMILKTGVRLHREKLHQHFTRHQIQSVYFNELQGFVSITIGGSKFTVYGTGSVMQSGKDKEVMRQEMGCFYEIFKMGIPFFAINEGAI